MLVHSLRRLTNDIFTKWQIRVFNYMSTIVNELIKYNCMDGLIPWSDIYNSRYSPSKHDTLSHLQLNVGPASTMDNSHPIHPNATHNFIWVKIIHSRRWTNIEPTIAQCLLFAGLLLLNTYPMEGDAFNPGTMLDQRLLGCVVYCTYVAVLSRCSDPSQKYLGSFSWTRLLVDVTDRVVSLPVKIVFLFFI